MSGLINASRYPIEKGARYIRLEHTGVTQGSLFLSDLDTSSDVLIPDLGILIPQAGGQDTFTTPLEVRTIQESDDLKALLVEFNEAV